MPRNGAGVFGVMNPILIGALRSSSAVNEDFTDMGEEITNTLPLDGQAGMTGQLRVVDGTPAAPGIGFKDDTNLGFRRTGVDAMAWVAAGQDRATMDANGKLTLLGGLDVTGTFGRTGGAVLGPQVLATSSVAPLVLRRTENTTDEVEIMSFESGSGAGNKGSLRIVGGGANDVQTLRFYIGATKIFEYTASLFTHETDTMFGSRITADADGFFDIAEVSAAPSAPAANIARAYARDVSGTTKMFFKDAAGNEHPFAPMTVDRQVFEASGTWTKPSGGQTMAMIEMWGGGGSGGTGGGAGDRPGGGGGGAYAAKIIALASLSASVAVTVGSGAAGQTVDNSTGNVGGTSSFGAYLSAFGGGGGGGTHGNPSGGGGGLTSAGGSNGGNGGGPIGSLGASTWGGSGTANAFGGAGGSSGAGATGLWGGGSGGAGFSTVGGNSVYGGAGGGANTGAGGSSVFGGSGGAGGAGASSNGSAPGGGSGAAGASGGADSGSGGRGEVRITCW